MKSTKNKEIEDKMLETLNDFMKKYGINEISFGKSHKVKKSEGRKSKKE